MLLVSNTIAEMTEIKCPTLPEFTLYNDRKQANKKEK